MLFTAGANAGQAATQQGSACAYLRGLVNDETAPLFLPSFPTASEGPLHESAFLYDNAVTAIALVSCGEPIKARRLTDAILYAQQHDRHWKDGRLRNAYRAGTVQGHQVKLPGWWDAGLKQWLEDKYQVGSDVGNMAWALLALLAVEPALQQPDYKAGALQLANWLERFNDKRGAHGYLGGLYGHEPEPVSVTWKSTEHNTDLVAVFRLLARATGDPLWNAKAQQATAFVSSMWIKDKNCFATGVGDDGVTRNPIVALDAQAWPLLAIPDFRHTYLAAVQCMDRFVGVADGYAYSEAKEGIWTEGSAQMQLLFALLGEPVRSEQLARVVRRQKTAEGGYLATDNAEIPTSFMLATDPTKPRLYFRLPHLGAAGWAALAEQKFNPFTFSAAFPNAQ